MAIDRKMTIAYGPDGQGHAVKLPPDRRTAEQVCREIAAAKGYTLNVVPEFGIEALGPDGKRYGHSPTFNILHGWLRSSRCKPLKTAAPR